jgi:catechol 2,3-dioxygenase-like lactoylglutathione lyase family enzyme
MHPLAAVGSLRTSVALLVGVIVALGALNDASAQSAGSPDDTTSRGHAAYVRGVQLSHDQQWGNALVAFEEAASLRDHPIVEMNIAYCQRALGRYVAARRTVQGVIAKPAGLDPKGLDDAQNYLAEFDKLIVRVAVQLDPASATLTVDGRPLVEGDGKDTYLGDVAPAGVGAPLGKPAFTVVLDPGAHVFRAVREGHQDALVSRSYPPGSSASLDLHLDVLPATVAIHSEPAAAIVRVDSREVGVAPIEFQRPAGQYKLEVLLDHYETYKAALELAPGQHADMTARLNPYTEPLTKKWWFWTGAAVVVVGGAVLTYFITRPAPQPPPYEAGSANWLVHTSGLRF